MTHVEAVAHKAAFFSGWTPAHVAEFKHRYYRDGIWASPFGLDGHGEHVAPFGLSKFGPPRLHPDDE